MGSLKFLKNIPATVLANDLPIYYSKTYISQLDSAVQSFCAIKQDTCELALMIHFQLSGSQAVSLKEAPFGSLYIGQPVETDAIQAFLQYAIENLKQAGITQLILKTAPPIYHTPSHLDESSLYSFGFSRLYTDINHHLPITNNALTDQISSMQKRRLNKCVKASFRFSKESPSRLKVAYEFITQCREEKNHSLSISFEKLEAAMNSLPEKYLLFCCYDGDRMIAASVCVVVNSSVLYHFLPASDKAYNTYSPMVFLISNLHQYGLLNQFEILDLGTSMLDNQPNDELIAFKKRMGGVQTKRNIYTLSL